MLSKKCGYGGNGGLPERPGSGDQKHPGGLHCAAHPKAAEKSGPPLPGKRVYLAIPAACGRGTGGGDGISDGRAAAKAAAVPPAGGDGAHGLHPAPGKEFSLPDRKTAARRLCHGRERVQPIFHGTAAGLHPDAGTKPYFRGGAAGIQALCDHDPAGADPVRRRCVRLDRPGRHAPAHAWREIGATLPSS